MPKEMLNRISPKSEYLRRGKSLSGVWIADDVRLAPFQQSFRSITLARHLRPPKRRPQRTRRTRTRARRTRVPRTARPKANLWTMLEVWRGSSPLLCEILYVYLSEAYSFASACHAEPIPSPCHVLSINPHIDQPPHSCFRLSPIFPFCLYTFN